MFPRRLVPDLRSLVRLAVAVALLTIGLSLAQGAQMVHAASSPAPPLPDASCAREPGLKSLVGKVSTPLTFINNSGVTVQTLWLDYTGKRVFYAQIPAGKRYVQSTWVTHPWIVADMAGKCITLFVTDGVQSTVTVGPGPSSATPTPADAGGLRPTATVVRCNRDTTTADPQFQCTAVVTDSGAPAAVPTHLPTGTVTWTSTVGSFLGSTCTLTLPDVGSPSCSVDYRASNQDVPIETDVPVTAAYSGDTLYQPSSGSPHLGPGLAAPQATDSGLPLWVEAAGGVAAVGAVLALLSSLHLGSGLIPSFGGGGAAAGGSGGGGSGGGEGPGAEAAQAQALQHILATITSSGKSVGGAKSGAGGGKPGAAKGGVTGKSVGGAATANGGKPGGPGKSVGGSGKHAGTKANSMPQADQNALMDLFNHLPPAGGVAP